MSYPALPLWKQVQQLEYDNQRLQCVENMTICGVPATEWVQLWQKYGEPVRITQLLDDLIAREREKADRGLGNAADETNQGGGGASKGERNDGLQPLSDAATASAHSAVTPDSAAAASFEERVKALYGKYTNLGQEHPSHGGLDLMIRRALKAEDERDEARSERWNWSDETGASFIDLRNALEKAGTTPYATTTGGLNRVAVAIECVRKLAAERDALKTDIARLTKEMDEAYAESDRSAKRAERWLLTYRDAVAEREALKAALDRLAESGK